MFYYLTTNDNIATKPRLCIVLRTYIENIIAAVFVG